MSSLKSRLVSVVLRHTRKRAFASAEGFRARIAADRRIENHEPPARLRRLLDIRERRIAGMPVFEVRPQGMKRSRKDTKRIIYLHGGAYVFQITSYHWLMVAEMAERLNARITVPIYPLAPETTVDHTFEKMMAFYRRVLKETDPSRLVFMGDSAGAHMSVVMSMTAKLEGLPLPAKQVLISPGLDMTLANPEVRELEKIDPWLAIEGGMEALRLCAPDMPLDDWRISPIYGDLTALPDTMVLTGTLDLLSADAIAFADRARDAGVDVELVVEEGMFHVWPLIDMPEARDARDRIVRYVSPDMDPPPAGHVWPNWRLFFGSPAETAH